MSDPLTFLSLPGEIREQIYAELLTADNNFYQVVDGEDPSESWAFDLSIYRTCKQIYNEAERVFRRVNTFVKMTTPWEEAVERTKSFALTPVLCRGRRAERFQAYQMDIIVDYIGSPHPGYSFIVDARDVLGFCRMWYYFDMSTPGLNGHFRVRMTLAGLADNPEMALPKNVQKKLVEPWGLVRSLDNLRIDGPHDDEVVEELRTAMQEPYPRPADCLERCEVAKDAGNAAFKAGNYSVALAHYIQAFEAIHITVSGKRRNVWAEGYFESTIGSGKFAGKYGGQIYLTFRIQLVANCIMAYLKLQDFEMAYYWGNRSIQIMRHHFGDEADVPRLTFPASEQWGKIYYRTAMAAKALGDMSEARNLIRIAANWLPNDAIVQRERSDWGNLQLG